MSHMCGNWSQERLLWDRCGEKCLSSQSSAYMPFLACSFTYFLPGVESRHSHSQIFKVFVAASSY